MQSLTLGIATACAGKPVVIRIKGVAVAICMGQLCGLVDLHALIAELTGHNIVAIGSAGRRGGYGIPNVFAGVCFVDCGDHLGLLVTAGAVANLFAIVGVGGVFGDLPLTVFVDMVGINDSSLALTAGAIANLFAIFGSGGFFGNLPLTVFVRMLRAAGHA